MNTLYNLQQQIFSALTANQPYAGNDLRIQAPLSTQQRLAIYQDSFTTALINVLRDTYNVCCKLVGDDFFNAMAATYQQQTPSVSPNINDYGASFSQFIAHFTPAASLPYLADVAALEWAWHLALHGKNDQRLAVEALAQLSPQQQAQLVFKLPSGSSLLTSSYPVQQIWAVNQENYPGEPWVDLNSGEVKLFVWREEMEVRIELLQDGEWRLLSMIKQGYSLENLCAAFIVDKTQQALAILFEKVVLNGWIVGFSDDFCLNSGVVPSLSQ